ncbi:hypothetical protein, partial [uncultured Prevotella sp.]|uniref:hypothetical protein n=1 Tax=uncultured Prevotella sp. TaxID=159272 RepID=UPI002599840E
ALPTVICLKVPFSDGLGGVVAGISIFGAFIGNKYYIPFYLAHGMIATLFYYVGHLSHKYSINKLSFKHWHLLLLGAFIIAGMKVGEPYFIIAKEDSLNAIRNRSENLLVNSLKNIGYDEKS